MLMDEQYYEVLEEFGDEFDVSMGVEVVQKLLKDMDLQQEICELCEELLIVNFEIKSKKIVKCLKLMEVFYEFGNDLMWMILSVLFVFLSDLCFLVFLDGGCFVILDLNDFYCRVINWNNCLKWFLDLNVSDIIVCNEKCML